jgi:hypothetical protein
MPSITSRQGLIDYCLRRLGAPAIQIDVAEEQIEDRIDDALQYFTEFHYDGVERVYFKHQVVQSNIDNKFIDIQDPLIISVNRMFAFSSANINMFDIRYQVRLNDFYNFNNVSMIHYQITRQHLALLDFLFNNEPTIRFNRKQNRIFVDLDWTQDITLNDFFLFDCWRALDPDQWTAVYDDRMLKRLATALIKEQWGNNLSKYNGIQLPGGVTLDGQRLKEEALQEIADTKHMIETTYQLPIDFQVG